jgi:hypothetical protein
MSKYTIRKIQRKDKTWYCSVARLYEAPPEHKPDDKYINDLIAAGAEVEELPYVAPEAPTDKELAEIEYDAKKQKLLEVVDEFLQKSDTSALSKDSKAVLSELSSLKTIMDA